MGITPVGSQACPPVVGGRLKGVRGSKLAAVRIGGKVYTTEPAVISFIATLSTDMKSVRPEVTETVCPPQDSSQATASEGLYLAKQHLNQALGREERAKDDEKTVAMK